MGAVGNAVYFGRSGRWEQGEVPNSSGPSISIHGIAWGPGLHTLLYQHSGDGGKQMDLSEASFKHRST